MGKSGIEKDPISQRKTRPPWTGSEMLLQCIRGSRNVGAVGFRRGGHRMDSNQGGGGLKIGAVVLDPIT